jgi:hypothetical protein
MNWVWRQWITPIEQGEWKGEPLHLYQDVSATRLPGGLETTLQVTSNMENLRKNIIL